MSNYNRRGMGRMMILGLLVLLFSACSKNKKERPHLVYNQKQLNLISNQSGFDASRTGTWEMSEDTGKLLQKGTLHHGAPTGKWSYFLSNRQLRVDWRHYSDGDLDIVLPKRWVIDSNNKFMLFAVLAKGEIDASKNFCIGIRTENPSWTLEEHYQKMKPLIKPIDSSSQKDNYLLQSSDLKVYFQFTRNTLLPNGQGPVNSGTVLFEKSNSIYELTLVSEPEISSAEEVSLLIVEIFKAMQIENEFMLSLGSDWHLTKIIERE